MNSRSRAHGRYANSPSPFLPPGRIALRENLSSGVGTDAKSYPRSLSNSSEVSQRQRTTRSTIALHEESRASRFFLPQHDRRERVNKRLSFIRGTKNLDHGVTLISKLSKASATREL